jgi:NAD(P)-dependent dehydrogenase (short-subunit alcohol dehydrogenase family)
LDLEIDGKRALVVGAGRGLGRNIAINLAEAGVKIAAVARTKADLENLLDEIGGREAGHFAVALDLIEPDGPSRLLSELDENFGSIDIVVHNIGGPVDIRDAFCSMEDWRKVQRLNIDIAVELNLTLIPRMQQQKWGRIVHISSIAGEENQGPIPYCAAKAALNAYTRSMGRLVSPDGVILTAVLPGAIFWEGGDWDKASREQPEHVERYLKERMAIGRFGEPDEIGKAVAFLCSKHASFFVGSIVPIDGGQGRTFF